ncbi:MAG: SusC/RagA family TonB-linked outer membrane protein [Cyclobacteriaceae bacterium]
MKNCLLLLIATMISLSHYGNAQDYQVSGIVRDDSGPLIGVNVIDKSDVTRGTITDVDGKFSIRVDDGNSILIFSYLGYQPQEIPINNRSQINITLEQETQLMSEVVVVGYGSQKKSDLTGAVVQVTNEDFVKGANTNAFQLLNGKASGVQINQTSSAPGGDVDIKIRGANSINGSNDVLVVIDGLPGGSPNALSPDDIESIEVLKDASASAIYGSRAANGVVLITTKKGRKGQTDISYSGYVGFQDVKDRVRMLNGREYLTVLNEINVESGGDILHPPEKIEQVGEGYDWQDIIFRNSIVHNHQLSFQGGSDLSQYYVSLNFLDNQGVIKNTAQERYNARVNYQIQPSDKFNFSLNLNLFRSVTDRIRLGRGTNEGVGVLSAALLFDPTIGPELNEEGFYDVNPLVAIENPMALLQGIDLQDVENTAYATAMGEYEILPGFKATLRLGTELTNLREDSYENQLTQIGRGLNGRATVESTEETYWLAEYLLSYELESGDHSLQVLGGITYENFEERFQFTTANDFLSDITGTNLLQSGNQETYQISSGRFVNRLNSQLGRINYSYKDKYLLTASIRRDGTSRFSDKNKYATFPSASVGWKLSEETFMQNQAFFDELKLRVGYGEIGNQGINNFETIQTFRAGSPAVLGGSLQNGAIPARIPNEDLVWETTRELNIGLDFGILNRRIGGSIEFYERFTEDQLFRQPVPLTTGFTSVRVNIGQVRNRGIDFALRSQNLTGGLKWETDLVFSVLENEVTELPEFAQQIIYGGFGFSGNYLVIQEGTPIASFYGYEIDGIFQVEDDIANSPQPNALPGHPRFRDTNGDGEITADDRVILGDPFPDFTFGFNNRFSYNRFDLEVYFLGVQGVQTFNNLVAESLYPINKERNHIAQNYLDRWTVDNPGAEFPSGENYTAYSDGENKVNTFTVQDASFIRLKNITLNYNLLLNGSGFFKGANVYVSGENLLTISDYDGYDPDANSDGVGVQRATFTDYPLARTIRICGTLNF